MVSTESNGPWWPSIPHQVEMMNNKTFEPDPIKPKSKRDNRKKKKKKEEKDEETVGAIVALIPNIPTIDIPEPAEG